MRFEPRGISHQALYEAIVLRHEMHLAGATVLRGLMDFGKSSRLHTAKVLWLLLICRLMIGGLLTIKKVKVISYCG